MEFAGKKLGDYAAVIVVPAVVAIATALLATLAKLAWFTAFWFLGMGQGVLLVLDVLVYLMWAVTIIVFLALAVYTGMAAAKRDFSQTQIAATGALMGAIGGVGVILYRTFTIVRKLYTQGLMGSLMDVVKYALIVISIPLVLAAVFAVIAIIAGKLAGRKK